MLQSRFLCSRARKKSDDLTTAIVLAGTSFPASAGADLHSLRVSLLVRPGELSSIDPHAMQDNRELARDGDLGLAEPISLGQPHASGEMDWSGRISKCGDAMLRSYLFEAAGVLLVSVKGLGPLKLYP